MLTGQGGVAVTHPGMEMAYQVQQLLHAALEGRGVAARVSPHRQSVRVEPGVVAGDPGVFRARLLDALGPGVGVCVRLSPAVE